MAGYIGGKVAVSAPQQIETKHTITATASQTSIPNVGYTVGAVHVYQNGIRLVDGTDYTATNGSTVTLETGATEGDQIVIVSHGSFETSDTVSKASGGTFSSNVTVSGSVTANSLIVPDGSIPLVDLDIDGGTDIGAALVDADLMVVDDGAGGTNRKATMARLATYIGTKVGGGLEFISSTDVSNAATASFTGFDSSKYDSYIFTLGNILPQTDDQLFQALLSVDDGSNYLSASDSYVKGVDAAASAGDAAYIPLAYRGIGNATNEGLNGEYSLICPHLNTTTYVTGFGLYTRENGALGGLVSGGYSLGKTKAATIVDGIQFKFASGNIVSGTITMYGRVNS
jgi:hypothetical protein